MAITRRECIKSFGAAGAAFAGWTAVSANPDEQTSKKEQKEHPMPQDRPNIVFIMADQLAASFIGCYGSGVNSTPTLDRLAEEGVRFDRFYAHVPVCAPNRASIFSGRSADVHGVLVNNYQLTTDSPLFSQVLQTNGYRTGGFGKFHFTSMLLPPPPDMKAYGFEEAAVIEDPRWGPWLDWVEREHPDQYERALATCWQVPYRSNYHGKDMDAAWHAAVVEYLAPLREASGWRTMFTSPLRPELHQTSYITDLSLDFMRRHQREHAGRPFFCFVSYVDPHDPYDPPAPYDALFDPADMADPMPALSEDQESPLMLSLRTSYLGYDEIIDKPEAIRKMRALYHGSLRLIDDNVKRIVDYLKQSGQLDNTLIFFITDHGDLMGDHGYIAKGVVHYDTGIRCPLIVHGPGVAAGVVSDRLSTSLDIYPTLCDFAGITTRPPLEGRSFASICHGQPETRPSWPEVTVRFGRATSIVTDDYWRFTTLERPGLGQMLNLKDDPLEQHNLYHDPKHAAKKLELFERYARAYAESRAVPHYANYPVIDGRHWVLGAQQIPKEAMPW